MKVLNLGKTIQGTLEAGIFMFEATSEWKVFPAKFSSRTSPMPFHLFYIHLFYSLLPRMKCLLSLLVGPPEMFPALNRRIRTLRLASSEIPSCSEHRSQYWRASHTPAHGAPNFKRGTEYQIPALRHPVAPHTLAGFYIAVHFGGDHDATSFQDAITALEIFSALVQTTIICTRREISS